MLGRPKLARYELGDEDVRALLRLLTPNLPTVDVDVTVRDSADAPVIATALGGGPDAIVTGDADILGDDALRAWLAESGVAVHSPAEMIAELA